MLYNLYAQFISSAAEKMNKLQKNTEIYEYEKMTCRFEVSGIFTVAYSNTILTSTLFRVVATVVLRS